MKTRGVAVSLYAAIVLICMMALPYQADAQSGRITGRVTDAGTGNPLPGANVVVNGTNFGDATSVTGEFLIARVPSGEHTLNVDYLGFASQSAEITVSADQVVIQDFSLSEQPIVGEENAGIWKFEAEPDGNSEKFLVDSIGPHLVADVEGLAIYYANDSRGYLIASSQGNDSYVIYEREENHKYVGTFRIAAGETIDGTFDTDGIDVSNFALAPLFPGGIFVVQDGSNPGGNQNFKCVQWELIARLFDPPLLVDTRWDPRTVGSGK
ncbi:MAG: phytase [Candidatus Neomarinimicrobiota bacterium]